MAIQVARHEFPTQQIGRAVEILSESARDEIGYVERNPRMFDGALGGCLTAAQARSVLDPASENLETWEAYVVAMQIGSALFASANATEGPVECRIDHKVRTIPATGPQSYVTAGNWITSLWLAITCRELDRMTQLCNVPLDLLRASGAEFDEYIYHWVDSLQTWHLQRPGLADKLLATINTSNPEVAQIAGQELMDKILYQPINLFYRYVRNDRPGFNEALEKALILHKEYWTANEERATDITGTVALGPLAITCLAYDAGFPIEVESEYLPQELIRRAWVGEFET